MNEFIFVEEENTFYEIDKECQLAMANHRENENCQDERREDGKKDNLENRRTKNVQRTGKQRCRRMEQGLRKKESSRRNKRGCSLCHALVLVYLLSLSKSSKKLG